ncbi:MAG: hypothetical protein ABL895_13100 [Cyclobacteriaceae bacterium]
MLRFTLSLFLVATLVVLTAWLGSVQAWWPLPLFWKEIVLFMFFITLIIGFRLVQMRRKHAVAFVQFYLLSITLKMAAGLAFIIFIILKTPMEAKGSAALFIVCYLLFTLVEVNFLMRKDPS